MVTVSVWLFGSHHLSGGPVLGRPRLDRYERHPSTAVAPKGGEVSAVDECLESTSDDNKAAVFDLGEQGTAPGTTDICIFHLALPVRAEKNGHVTPCPAGCGAVVEGRGC